MDKKAIRKFAIEARRKLIEGVSAQAYKLGIKESGLEQLYTSDQFFITNNGDLIKEKDTTKYKNLVQLYKKLEIEQSAQEIFEKIVEEAAYTWFNRIVAIRYMEIHDYLPIRKKLFSSNNQNQKIPDAIEDVGEIAEELNLNMDFVWELKDKNKEDELFKYLFLKQCNQLGELLPELFPKIDDLYELLLPENILKGFINDLINCDIPYEDWYEVEIIGWLFQYYSAEKKELVGGLKNAQVSKWDLPVVTQLFTPKWIVEYMLQNSLGKIYDELFPKNDYKKQWNYYLYAENTVQVIPPSVKKIDDIKIIDPACGSGHILIQAFDMLYEMYLEQGYFTKEIPFLIMKNNLFGLEIDKRSTQITHLALLLKILEKNPRFLKKGAKIGFQVYEWADVKTNVSQEALDFLSTDVNVHEAIRDLEKRCENAKQFGSLMRIGNFDYKLIEKLLIQNTAEKELNIYNASLQYELEEKLSQLLKLSIIFQQKYEVVITNPPYHNKFNPIIKKFMKTNYKNTKSDLYSAFMEKCFEMLAEYAYEAMMTPYTWMFISSHAKLRKYLLSKGSIVSLVQLEYSAFKDATVPICTFVIQKQIVHRVGEFVRLANFKGAEAQPTKLIECVNNPEVNYRYTSNANSFSKIPGSPIAYWVSETTKKSFDENKSLNSVALPKQGLATGDNNQFLRLWFEIADTKMATNSKCMLPKWFPISKGGSFRKWYGNNSYVVNWEENGFEIKNFFSGSKKLKSRPQNLDFYFKKGITWSTISSSKISFRYHNNAIFETKGSVIFPQKDYYCVFGYLNSKLTNHFLTVTSPTLDYHEGPLGKIPYKDIQSNLVETLVKENIKLAKKDWDSFENSWEFQKHPLIANKTIKQAFQEWENESIENFNCVKSNEEELNKIFIHLYNLQNELTPEVPEEEITIRKGNQLREVKSLLSYLIGLIFGRYSLDQPGIVYAGGNWDTSKYSSFQPDEDNIIPFTEENYFEDDIILRVEYLLTLIYSEETLEENLDYIANTLELKKNETSRGRIRRYFLKEFYQDHLKIYQKRPIYWMITSGKKGAFKGLIYLHRYHCDTLAQIRTDYILPLIKTMDNLMSLEKALIDDLEIDQKSKITAQKNWEQLALRQDEVKDFSKVIDHMANKRIQLELDDGVILNHAKFQNIDIDKGVGNLFERINR